MTAKEYLETEDKVVFTRVIEYTDLIEEMFEKEPDGRKKEWKIWMEKQNALIKGVNALAGHKIYKDIR